MTAGARRRLDQLLVDRELAPTRARAQALILAGTVLVNGQRVDKAGTPIGEDATVELIRPDHPWVSRGALKLLHGLAQWPIDVTGWRCLDVGASTGGFTEVLLARGARQVIAVDVGTNQLAWKIRSDPRVVVHEQTNARSLALDLLDGEGVDLITIDVAFISQTLILPTFPALLKLHGQVISLIKPQFEVAKGEVGTKGVVRDLGLREQSVRRVLGAYEAAGFAVRGLVASEPPGPEGNREFLAWLERDGVGVEWGSLLEAALNV